MVLPSAQNNISLVATSATTRSIVSVESDLPVLIAEDSEDEITLYRMAFRKIGFTNFRFVSDGTEAIDYLKGEGKYGDRQEYPFPGWLILDLKMPRKSGMEARKWL